MIASAWKREENKYAIQINDVKKSDKQELKKMFKEWNQMSIGWNLDKDYEIYIYTKPFRDQKEWLEWAKTCPIQIIELKQKSDSVEKVQINCKKKKRDNK